MSWSLLQCLSVGNWEGPAGHSSQHGSFQNSLLGQEARTEEEGHWTLLGSVLVLNPDTKGGYSQAPLSSSPLSPLPSFPGQIPLFSLCSGDHPLQDWSGQGLPKGASSLEDPALRRVQACGAPFQGAGEDPAPAAGLCPPSPGAQRPQGTLSRGLWEEAGMADGAWGCFLI